LRARSQLAMPQHETRSRKRSPSVWLIRSRQAQSQFDADVLVTPSYATWNDFGYLIRAEVGLRTSEGRREWLGAFFALKGHKNLAAFVRERLTDSESGVSLDSLGVPFASLLSESKHYSLVRRVVGAEAGRRLLLAIHDVSLLQSQDEEVPDWMDFFATDIFTHAMTRSSEGHFAYRHGALVLAGRGTTDVDARQKMVVDLTRFGPKLRFDFRFEASNALRGRIAVIIGKNGCGKTSSLARLAAGLATDKRQGVSFDQRPVINQVLAFAHSGAIRLFKQRPDRPGAANVRAFALDPSTSLRAPQRERQTRLLVDIARAVDAGFRPLDDFKEIIEREFSGLQLCIPVRADTYEEPTDHVYSNGMPFVHLQRWMRGGEGQRLTAAAGVDHERGLLFLDKDAKVRTLSLGQAAFLNFSLNALANAGPASALLIDEPENFLHPNLISRFMRVLHRILESTGSIAVVATHSPFVVREVQSAQVHVIRQVNDDGPVSVVHPRLQTLGTNVASIADEVFGDDLPEHLFELVLRESNLQALEFDEMLEQYAGELSTEALMYLRRRQRGGASK
jgi:ABC-type transport system involved in cytochrome c biogenesis ATPase subunit